MKLLPLSVSDPEHLELAARLLSQYYDKLNASLGVKYYSADTNLLEKTIPKAASKNVTYLFIKEEQKIVGLVAVQFYSRKDVNKIANILLVYIPEAQISSVRFEELGTKLLTFLQTQRAELIEATLTPHIRSEARLKSYLKRYGFKTLSTTFIAPFTPNTTLQKHDHLS